MEKDEKIIEIKDFSDITREQASEVTQHLDNGGSIKIVQSITPWQKQDPVNTSVVASSLYGTMVSSYVDSQSDKNESGFDRKRINSEAWKKFNENPFVRRSINDVVGRVTGEEFGFFSRVRDIQEWMNTIIYDVRNELYKAWDGYVARKLVETELFLALTIDETDGFVEVDVVEPGLIDGTTDFCTGGIVTHPTKTTLPIYYNVKLTDTNGYNKDVLIPSIYTAYLPNIEESVAGKLNGLGTPPKASKEVKAKTKGKLKYRTYIVSWHHGIREIIRTVSDLRTIFEPLEDYKEAKKWRFEYMKALCSYFIFYEFEDVKSWLRWLALTDEQKRSTGLGQPLRPADKLFLPPGVKGTIQNPQIPSLSGQDEDLLKMISSGMRQPYDMLSGDLKGPTYASVKGSRNPYLDYISDLRNTAEQFFVHDFWKAVFYIKACFDKSYSQYKIKEVVGFKNKKEVSETVTYKPEQLIDAVFPQSSSVDVQSVANAMLGSKRGSLSYHLGISKEMIANRLGINNFYGALLKGATERANIPEDLLPEDKSIDELDSGLGSKAGPEAKGTSTKPKPKLKLRQSEEE